ncbi:putative PLAC8 motif-containing protein [Medicago truncatula]|uniref:PLAC8 family protein n=1 Tax=Medicago truncatula TaxID=3880 RepID=G7I4T3_MEDTR|nr:cell number regulator 9 [Medicago truncatula]AES61069.1 PLAC8 family protein [Medicago truncatula]RHN80354.1 putative PLAC8 motif-containing protein [Medicago truncatula]
MNIFGRSSPPKWSAKLCGCGENPGTCLITCCLPCITFGQIAEVVDEGRSSCAMQGCVYGLLMTITCHWLYSCLYREKLRAKYGLPAEPCCDCCVHFCCDACALCQEHAELKARGFNPSKGWIGPPHAPPRMPPTMFR